MSSASASLTISRRRCQPVLVLALGAAILGTPWAAAAKAIDCENTEVESELLACANQDFTDNQKKLEMLSRKAMTQLPAAAQPVFAKAQQAWAAYRDADCAWNAYEIDSGVTSELIQATCRADLTAARIEEIEAGVGPR